MPRSRSGSTSSTQSKMLFFTTPTESSSITLTPLQLLKDLNKLRSDETKLQKQEENLTAKSELHKELSKKIASLQSSLDEIDSYQERDRYRFVQQELKKAQKELDSKGLSLYSYSAESIATTLKKIPEERKQMQEKIAKIQDILKKKFASFFETLQTNLKEDTEKYKAYLIEETKKAALKFNQDIAGKIIFAGGKDHSKDYMINIKALADAMCKQEETEYLIGDNPHRHYDGAKELRKNFMKIYNKHEALAAFEKETKVIAEDIENKAVDPKSKIAQIQQSLKKIAIIRDKRNWYDPSTPKGAAVLEALEKRLVAAEKALAQLMQQKVTIDLEQTKASHNHATTTAAGSATTAAAATGSATTAAVAKAEESDDRSVSPPPSPGSRGSHYS